MGKPITRLLLIIFCVVLGTQLNSGQENGVQVCDPATCQLPACFCAGTRIPGGLDPVDTPQMVLFTFNNAVNDRVSLPLMDLFSVTKNRKNPNGCPISMTLFVSHMYTDNCLVAEFYRDGHEIASHSITHKLPVDYWADAPYEDYDTEINGQREFLSKLAGIELDQIVGYRSPFLQLGGDNQFQVLQDRNFSYDSSMLVTSLPTEAPYWPYTLDFPKQTACRNPPCPNQGYPGIWELPVQPLPDDRGTVCRFIDDCTASMTADQIYDYLQRSFDRHYSVNRAPLILNIHSYWFSNNPNSLQALERFVQDLVPREDVYLITSTQLVEWLKNPTPLSALNDFNPWKCEERSTSSCTKRILRAGENRTKRAGYESYQSDLQKVVTVAAEDGGMSIVVWVLLLFLTFFIYLLIQDESQA